MRFGFARVSRIAVFGMFVAAAACSSDDTKEDASELPPPVLGDAPEELTERQSTALKSWMVRYTQQADSDFCWRRSYGRGAGTPLSTCASGERSGALCYPTCRTGFDGAGPVCWERCRAGYTDDGAFCRKDPVIVGKTSYGRGAGYVSNGDCLREHPSCEKNGLLFYPTCKSGFSATGCCVCSENCPAGYVDDGATCRKVGDLYAKASYGRGAGTPLACAADEQVSGALCYPPCKAEHEGIGPVCWDRCPASQAFVCGAACAKSEVKCAEAVLEMVVAPIELVENILGFVLTGGAANGAKTAVKAAVKGAAAAGGKAAVRAALRQTDTFAKVVAKLEGNVRGRLLEELKEETAKTMIEGAAENLLVASLSRDDVELASVLGDLDPTGVAAVVAAFAQPVCETDRMPDLAAIARTSPLLPSNLARSRPVTLSSSAPGSVGANAVDGLLGPANAATNEEEAPFIRIDLGRQAWIGSVILHHDASTTLGRFEILLSDESGALTSIETVGGNVGPLAEFRFARPARFVTVRGTSRSALALTEVEVHESDMVASLTSASYLDVARGQPTSQSSTLAERGSARAVDGIVSGSAETGAAVTKEEEAPWWQVDLGRVQTVESVFLYPPTKGTLENLDVVLLDADPSKEAYRTTVKGPVSRPVEVRLGPRGRYLRVVRRTRGTLALAEVAVHALVPNLAFGKNATQSSDGSSSSLAAFAVDGERDARVASTRVTYRPSWEVDLGRSRNVSRVRIWDAMPAGLSNVTLSLLESRNECPKGKPMPVCGVRLVEVASVPVASALEEGAIVPIVGRGRIVRIQSNETTSLRLREVEVF